MTIEEAKHEADKFAPEAAKWEAEYRDLVRREPSVLATCISDVAPQTVIVDRGKGEITVALTYQMAKNKALQDQAYLDHLYQIKQAQERYLAAEKAFRTIIEYLKAVQSDNYKQQAKIKAGIL